MKISNIMCIVALVAFGSMNAQAEIENRKCPNGGTFSITSHDTLHYSPPPHLDDHGEDGWHQYVCCDKAGNVFTTQSFSEVEDKCWSIGVPAKSTAARVSVIN